MRAGASGSAPAEVWRVSFRRRERCRSGTTAPVAITSITFGGRKPEPRPEIPVPYAERTLHATFAALTFVNEDSIRFRYRVTGLDRNWTEARGGDAHVAGIPAGQYTFEVQAAAKPGK